MKRLRVTIIDLISNKPTRRLYKRIVNPNYASIMPQVSAVWCQQLGAQVRFISYTGTEDFSRELLRDTDVLIISAFSLSAQLAYAISNLYRREGAVTVLGGPHARCYPEDAAKYFDYVLGLTDKAVLAEVLADAAPHRPLGRQITALKQPAYLPGVKERWKFIEQTLAKAPFFKVVPMIGSTGCPYTCSFCIDSTMAYQTLGFEQIQEDLEFLQTKFARPKVSWHDPNFGVRFDDYLSVIEAASPKGKIQFVAESSLSLLPEKRLKRLQKNGFKAMLPGIESWYSLGNKSKTGNDTGLEKVKQISDHINMILRYIPFVQTNFVLGLDCDEGPEPFELTKKFLDLTPGAYPAFSMFTCYGRAAPLNLELQRQGRVLPVPFHFLNSTRAMNVKPKNYDWGDFFGHIENLTAYAHSHKMNLRRFKSAGGALSKSISAIRGFTSNKADYFRNMHHLMREDAQFRGYFEAENTTLPAFFAQKLETDLGPFWQALPEGALEHDPYAYLNSMPGSEPGSEPEKEPSQTRIKITKRPSTAKVAAP